MTTNGIEWQVAGQVKRNGRVGSPNDVRVNPPGLCL